SRQRTGDPLRASLRGRGPRRRQGADRADRRPARIDRTLDRPAPALRDEGRRRSGRPAEIPARWATAGRYAVAAPQIRNFREDGQPSENRAFLEVYFFQNASSTVA